MPFPSIYHTPSRSYTPAEFVDTFNRYPSHQAAVDGMGICSRRLSVIATRLRARGFPVRKYKSGRAEL